MWNLEPAWTAFEQLVADAIAQAPLLAVGLVLLVVTWYGARVTVWTARGILRRRMRSRLLRDVTARAAAVPVFLFGLYVVLKVSGLTRLAVSVLGGAGLVGLIIGFAFRDIAENFLASILLGLQHPFAAGDMIEVAGHKGFVQSVNTRSTLLMTLEGNHVQIPNATIYKSTITNFTANPFARFDFRVGIGYDDSIPHAQRVALDVLRAHPAVVADPEPLVLVDELAAATVNLRIYFWMDIAQYSQFKVRSAVIRQTKTAFDRAGISMPDEAREVVFPAGVPVRMASDEAVPAVGPPPAGTASPIHGEDDAPAEQAEGDLTTEATEIRDQARRARAPEGGGANLLDDL